VDATCRDIAADYEEDDLACDWEALLAEQHPQRSRLIAFYLPAIMKMSSEMMAVANQYRALIMQIMARGGDELELARARSRFEPLIERQAKDIKRRLKQLFEGLAWAASELGVAAVAGRRRRRVIWVLDPAAQHCEDCPGLAAGSPYANLADIGTVPGGPGVACGAHCRCHLEFE
jgi:hypothetical protein